MFGRQRHDPLSNADVVVRRPQLHVPALHFVEDAGVPGLAAELDRDVILSRPAAQTKFLDQVDDRRGGNTCSMCH